MLPGTLSSWMLDVMSELVKKKLETNQEFHDALMETKNKVLAEATGDLFFASGLSLELTMTTRPTNYPGLNHLGKILMELRSLCLLTEELVSEDLEGNHLQNAN